MIRVFIKSSDKKIWRIWIFDFKKNIGSMKISDSRIGMTGYYLHNLIGWWKEADMIDSLV